MPRDDGQSLRRQKNIRFYCRAGACSRRLLFSAGSYRQEQAPALQYDRTVSGSGESGFYSRQKMEGEKKRLHLRVLYSSFSTDKVVRKLYAHDSEFIEIQRARQGKWKNLKRPKRSGSDG